MLIPSSWKVIRNSTRMGVSKAEILKRIYEAELEYPGGGYKVKRLIFIKENGQEFQQKDDNNITGFCRWAKVFELNFFIRKTFLYMVKPGGQNHPQFPGCLALNETSEWPYKT